MSAFHLIKSGPETEKHQQKKIQNNCDNNAQRQRGLGYFSLGFLIDNLRHLHD